MNSHAVLTGHPLFLPAMMLILLGALTKSAQFPFHIWLPDAMEAPTPVSAYLHSATMVKAGIYLAARLTPVFGGTAAWFWLISGFGLVTLLWGSISAVKQTDLKALLAYSTISQLGLIMSLIGVGSAALHNGVDLTNESYVLAMTAAIFHLINHATFKGALFMVAGIVDHETGTRDIRKLGGLAALMPITFTIAMLGAFSMAGLPPLNGFLSKEMFFTGMLNASRLEIFRMDTWGVLFPVIAWVASVWTFIYSLIFVFRTFTGRLKPDQLPNKPQEASLGLLLPPAILVSLVVVFGLFPDILSFSLIEPALASVYPSLISADEQFHVHIAFWHGWTTEVYMTIGVVIVGSLLFASLRAWQGLYGRLPQQLSLNALYDGGMSSLRLLSSRFTRSYMTGSVRDYLTYIFGFMILLVGCLLIFTGSLDRIGYGEYADISFYEGALALVMVISALAAIVAQDRLTIIILVGAVGYMVTLFFVLFRAPDLALTQMIIETVSVSLFLLCFYHLPKLRKDRFTIRPKLGNLLISLGVGLVVMITALSASGSRTFASISDFYLENSHKLGGGDNVVNVILVDFRGFDTMLEITVLGIASLGIFTLIKLREQAHQPLPLVKTIHRRYSVRINDTIFRTAARWLSFIIMLFSLYIFLAGHNQPGGGFIGGLIAAGSLVLLALAFGSGYVRKVLPINYRILTALGLLIAVMTGAGSFVYNLPFLSHAFGYYDLPLLGETELATATIFDLGVYLTVIGVAMTIILTIGEDR
jgi:multicomponent Na+:H+ antiporter subunit A